MSDESKRAEDLLKKLRRLPENSACPNCGTQAPHGIGFGNICVKFKTFVCDLCKTSHQAISHRVKSVTMSTWTLDEVMELTKQRLGGNQVARHVWLSKAPNFGGKYNGGEFCSQYILSQDDLPLFGPRGTYAELLAHSSPSSLSLSSLLLSSSGVRPKAGDRIENFKQFVVDCYESGMFKATTPFVDTAGDDDVETNAPTATNTRRGRVDQSSSSSSSSSSTPSRSAARAKAPPAPAPAPQGDLVDLLDGPSPVVSVFSSGPSLSAASDDFGGFVSAPMPAGDSRIQAPVGWAQDPFASFSSSSASASSFTTTATTTAPPTAVAPAAAAAKDPFADPFGLGSLTLQPQAVPQAVSQPAMRSAINVQGNPISSMPVSPRGPAGLQQGMGMGAMGGMGAPQQPMMNMGMGMNAMNGMGGGMGMGMGMGRPAPMMGSAPMPNGYAMMPPQMQAPMRGMQPQMPPPAMAMGIGGGGVMNAGVGSNAGFAIGAMPVLLNQQGRGLSSGTSTSTKPQDSFDFVSNMLK